MICDATKLPSTSGDTEKVTSDTIFFKKKAQNIMCYKEFLDLN